MTDTRSKWLAPLLGLVYLAGAGYAVRLALDPRTYFFHSAAQRAEWSMPWPMVAFVCLLMFGEVLVVFAALANLDGQSIWRRAAAGATVMALWAVPSTFMGYLHAAGFLTWHALWVWGLTAILVVSAVSSLGLAGARRLGVVHGTKPAA